MWGRAIAVWRLVMAVEFVYGGLRRILLSPRVGDRVGRAFGDDTVGGVATPPRVCESLKARLAWGTGCGDLPLLGMEGR